MFVAVFLYSRWSSKGALLASIALTAVGLVGVIHFELVSPAAVSPVWSIAVLIVGINGIIVMLLPYAAESYLLKIRGRATGWAAACTKAGGLAAQCLSLVGPVPALFTAALLILVPVPVPVRCCCRWHSSDGSASKPAVATCATSKWKLCTPNEHARRENQPEQP